MGELHNVCRGSWLSVVLCKPRASLILPFLKIEHPVMSYVVTLAQQSFLSVPSEMPSNKSNH